MLLQNHCGSGISRHLASHGVASLRVAAGSLIGSLGANDICEIRHLCEATNEARRTDRKLLRSLLAKGQPHEPIWDQVLRGSRGRVGERGDLVSVVARRAAAASAADSAAGRALSDHRRWPRLALVADPCCVTCRTASIRARARREQLRAEAAERAAPLRRGRRAIHPARLPRRAPPGRSRCASGAS